MNLYRTALAALLLTGFSSCGPQAIDDFNDLSIPLQDQNGAPIVFPDDLKGKPVVLGFIYTHCPDICSLITANILQIQQQTGADAHYVLITFDPLRDDPETLKRYADAFGMDREPFTFLTGGEDDVRRLMERMRVRTSVSYRQTVEAGDEVYFLNHSDKLMLLDDASRLIVEYGGSMTAPALVAEDLARL